MDQALDAVMSMAVFLTGFLVFSLVYSNALLGVVGEAPSAEAPVKVIRYPHHFSVREVKPGLFEVTDSEGAKGVWARCFVVEPSGDWYVSAGQGMGAVLTMANEQQAYTLSDRAKHPYVEIN